MYILCILFCFLEKKSCKNYPNFPKFPGKKLKNQNLSKSLVFRYFGLFFSKFSNKKITKQNLLIFKKKHSESFTSNFLSKKDFCDINTF